MKIVVGLGNPGARYAATRHNIGARIVDRFAFDCGFRLAERRFESRFGRGRIPPPAGRPLGDSAEHPADLPDLNVAVLVPETYMNHSGTAVAAALDSLPVDDIRTDLLVVVDDLDLPFGRLRIRPRGSSAGHRGLEDIAGRIDSSDFPRLRFGIGRPEPEIDPVDWVLRAFSSAEEAALEERIPLAAEAVGSILIDGVVPSMNRYNPDPESGD
ncbi:MAG: aminoacyl-tRNA hydrolase [Deltaproteobacteria bacterium]|nr:aminoacyl-tRNA hydrolase [Deltaproteobacteria bacterium]MBW2693188.1 aminoacyl-tRNA hydrolase [Deltaproteobacteria bacterium]